MIDVTPTKALTALLARPTSKVWLRASSPRSPGSVGSLFDVPVTSYLSFGVHGLEFSSQSPSQNPISLGWNRTGTFFYRVHQDYSPTFTPTVSHTWNPDYHTTEFRRATLHSRMSSGQTSSVGMCAVSQSTATFLPFNR